MPTRRSVSRCSSIIPTWERATGSRSRTSSGAGNLLGAEQSGHAQAVGFDLYMRWLEETVRALRGQGTVEQPAPPDVVLDRPAHLSDGYVPDDDVKLDLYRRLARATTSGDI